MYATSISQNSSPAESASIEHKRMADEIADVISYLRRSAWWRVGREEGSIELNGEGETDQIKGKLR